MNLSEMAENVIQIKQSIDELNQDYISSKIIMNKTFNFMLQAKHTVKRLQIFYWNNKNIRELLDFKLSYDAANTLYEDIRKSYKQYCDKLKNLKKQIKDRQRQISAINRELRR